MKKVFENVGGTLQRIAEIDFVLGLLCMVICAIVEIACGFEFSGIVIGSGLVAGGGLFGHAYFLYAFGQITNDVHTMATASPESLPQEDEIPEI